MYQPKKYLKKDRDYIFSFIAQHPFATMVLKGERLLATHIPVLAEGNVENFILYSHIANHNEQLQYLKDGAEVLLIFQGAHSYISSSWYAEKDISTWDYSAVHVNAKLKLQTNEELEDSLNKLVQRFEKDQDKPLYFEALPDKLVADHLPLITGFWCEPYKVEAIAKFHQSHPREDLENVSRQLEKQPGCMAQAVSKEIQKENGIG